VQAQNQTPELCLLAVNQNVNALKYIKDENLQKIIKKFNCFDNEVLEFIRTNPSIENSFNKGQKEFYEDYCARQLTKSCKE
jgi:ADP-dependent phosphofructokinase/glucokinase